GGPAEAGSDPMQLTQVRVREVGVPLADVFDRLVHPLLLILGVGVEDPAAVDVAEELVTGSILQLLFGHDSSPPLMRSRACRARHVRRLKTTNITEPKWSQNGLPSHPHTRA